MSRVRWSVALLGAGLLILAGVSRCSTIAIVPPAGPERSSGQRSESAARPSQVAGGTERAVPELQGRRDLGGAEFVVSVCDAQRQPLAGIGVEVFGADAAQPVARRRTGPDGLCRIPLALDPVWLLANPLAADAPAFTEELVDCSAAPTGRDPVQVVLRRRSSSMVVAAVDDTGAPVPDLSVVVHFGAPGDTELPAVPMPRMTVLLPDEPRERVREIVDRRRRPLRWESLPRTDARGTVRVDRLPAGPVGVAVVHGNQSFGWMLPEPSSRVVSLGVDTVHRETFLLQRRGRVQFSIDGMVQPGFSLRLAGRSAEGDALISARLRMRKSGDVPGAECVADPGTYDLSPTLAEDQPYAVWPLAPVTVVAGGVTPVAVRVRSAAGVVRGRVRLPDGRPATESKVVLEWAGGGGGPVPRHVDIDGEGRFVARGLLPAEYQVSVQPAFRWARHGLVAPSPQRVWPGETLELRLQRRP